MPGYHAGEASRQSRVSSWAWINPWSSPTPIQVLTLAEIQSDPYWKLVQSEIVRSTDNLILEARERKRTKALLADLLKQGLETIFIADDYNHGDLEAIPGMFAGSQWNWDMSRVAMVLIKLYLGIWKKAEAGATLTHAEIETGLFIDKTAMNMAEREAAAKSAGSLLAEIVWLVAVAALN